MKRDTKAASGSFHRCGKAAIWGFGLWALCAFSGVKALASQQAQQAPQQQQYPEFPAGAGRDTFIRVCSNCHSPDNVKAHGQDRQGWENTITKMAGFGANATDAEFTEILDYLTKNFPPPTDKKINVNKATASELQSGLGLSAEQASAVVQYREKNGEFKSIDDLKKVPNIDAQKLDAEKDRVAF